MQDPIFVVGAGRSGSTAFFELLTYTREATWLTELARPTPTWQERAFFALCDRPLIGDLLRRRYRPSEAYEFWSALYPGFSTPCRDLTSADVSERVRTRIERRIEAMRLPGRPRRLFKITGWPRLGFLNAIFPEARFVHIVRDGRAVANSLLNVPWWRGWQGPANWRWGELDDAYDALWRAHGHSFVALAGIQWRVLMDAMRRARREVDAERFLEIRYEDLCASPAAVLERACAFMGLADSRRIVERGAGLRTQNDKWRKELSVAQQAVLDAVVAEGLGEFGYE